MPMVWGRGGSGYGAATLSPMEFGSSSVLLPREGRVLLAALVVAVTTAALLAAYVARRRAMTARSVSAGVVGAAEALRDATGDGGAWREMNRHMRRFRRLRAVVEGRAAADGADYDGAEDGGAAAMARAEVVGRACEDLACIYASLGLPSSALLQLEGIGAGAARCEAPAAPDAAPPGADDEEARTARALRRALAARSCDFGDARGREAVEHFFEYHARLIGKLVGVHT